MKYQVTKTDLTRAAIAASKMSGSLIPATATVQVDAGRNALEFRITDLEIYRLERIAAERIDGRGSASVRVVARSLRDVVKAQPDKVLSVEISADSLAVGGVPVEVSEVPAEDMPTWPDEIHDAGSVALDWSTFAAAVAKVEPAISKEESRFTLCAAHIKATGTAAELAATDGHRAHVATFATRAEVSDDEVSDLIPAAVVRDLKTSARLRAIGRELRPVLEVGEHHSRLTCTATGGRGVVWLWRKVEGTFPDVDRIFRPLESMTGAAIDADAWAVTVKALLPTVDDRAPALRFVLTPNGTEISTGRDALEPTAAKQMPERWDFPPHGDGDKYTGGRVVGMNPHYLADLFKVGATAVYFAEDNPRDFAMQATGEGFKALLMPIRIDGDEDYEDEVAQTVSERFDVAAVSKPTPAAIVAPAAPEKPTRAKKPARKPAKRQPARAKGRQRPKRPAAKRPAAKRPAPAKDIRPARPVAVDGEAGDVLRWALDAGHAAEMRGAWVWVRFDGKPPAEIREGLKAHRLRWAKRRSLRDRCSWWYWAPARPAVEAKRAA